MVNEALNKGKKTEIHLYGSSAAIEDGRYENYPAT